MPISFKILERRPLNLRVPPTKKPMTSHPPAAAGLETETSAPDPDVGDSNKSEHVAASKEVVSSPALIGSSKLVKSSKLANPSKLVKSSKLVEATKVGVDSSKRDEKVKYLVANLA